MTSQIEELLSIQRAKNDGARRQPRQVDVGRRGAIIHRGQRPTPPNDVQARESIDSMLRASGWMDQDQLNLRAVREFTPVTGRADCVL
ncbi:hypothetical protein ABT373_17830 [Streptomyces sp. NPDC000070]|uniref:hypothetical protein n=1 Tax=Streptomyces sp. NPDC000070 TaxID=3154240 RepID=UPI00332DB660